MKIKLFIYSFIILPVSIVAQYTSELPNDINRFKSFEEHLELCKQRYDPESCSFIQKHAIKYWNQLCIHYGVGASVSSQERNKPYKTCKVLTEAVEFLIKKESGSQEN